MSLILDPGVSFAGCTPALVQFYNWLDKNVDGLYVSSTKRNGTTSYHDIGQAIDISINDQAIYDRTLRTLIPQQASFAEGIHQGEPGHINWSVKNGRDVPYPSFWGQATWDAHLNHIHIAVPRADVWVPAVVPPKPPAPKPPTAVAILAGWW